MTPHILSLDAFLFPQGGILGAYPTLIRTLPVSLPLADVDEIKSVLAAFALELPKEEGVRGEILNSVGRLGPVDGFLSNPASFAWLESSVALRKLSEGRFTEAAGRVKQKMEAGTLRFVEPPMLTREVRNAMWGLPLNADWETAVLHLGYFEPETLGLKWLPSDIYLAFVNKIAYRAVSFLKGLAEQEIVRSNPVIAELLVDEVKYGDILDRQRLEGALEDAIRELAEREQIEIPKVSVSSHSEVRDGKSVTVFRISIKI